MRRWHLQAVEFFSMMTSQDTFHWMMKTDVSWEIDKIHVDEVTISFYGCCGFVLKILSSRFYHAQLPNLQCGVEREAGFLRWHKHGACKKNYSNYWPEDSLEWNQVAMKEYLFQLTIAPMDTDYMEAFQLDRAFLVHSCSRWIDRMASYLSELSAHFVSLPGAISKVLHCCTNLKLTSTVQNPLVLTKILCTCQDNIPRDLLHLVVPQQRNAVGPWLFLDLKKGSYCTQGIPFRLEHVRHACAQTNLRARVEVMDSNFKEDGVVVMRSQFSVMSRFLFWFLKQGGLDIWTSFVLCFKTEYYLIKFFRITSLSQLEAEIDWLTEWVNDNDVSNFQLPTEIMQVVVLRCMKKFLRVRTGPVLFDNRPCEGQLSQVIPSALLTELPSKAFKQQLQHFAPQERNSATRMSSFVWTQATAYFTHLNNCTLRKKVFPFIRSLMQVLKVTNLRMLQDSIDDLQEFCSKSSMLCPQLVNCLSMLLRCQRPACYQLEGVNWQRWKHSRLDCSTRKECKSRDSQCTITSQESTILSKEQEVHYGPIRDDYWKYGGQMPYYAFHSGTGYKEVVVANSMSIVLKQALLGRTNSYNSEGNISEALVAKTPHQHVFCPGKFPFSASNDKHLFHFLMEDVARVSTKKPNLVCSLWALRMLMVLNQAGIYSVLELYHDLFCIPSSMELDDRLKKECQQALWLGLWDKEELEEVDMISHTNPDFFDWNNPFPPGLAASEYVSGLKAELDEQAFRSRAHQVPLCIYMHKNTSDQIP